MSNNNSTAFGDQQPAASARPIVVSPGDATRAFVRQTATFSAVEITPTEATYVGRPTLVGDREALLEALYRDRDPLIEKEALGRLSQDDQERLRDIETEIDRWESRGVPVRDEALWENLETLARRTLDLQAHIERKRSGG